MKLESVPDLGELLVSCISWWLSHAGSAVGVWIIACVAGAALALWSTRAVGRLWNRSHALRMLEVLAGVFFAFSTFGGVLLWPSVAALSSAARVSIRIWQAELNIDSEWQKLTFGRAFREVKSLGVEDFSKAKDFIPLTRRASVLKVAEVYANGAARHFSTSRPFLSYIIQPGTTLPEKRIVDSVESYFQNGGEKYNATQAVELAATHLSESAEAQAPRLVAVAHGFLVAAWLVVACATLGFVSWRAYRSL